MRGRVCLVTGATSGIGRAAALGLARLGATVVMMVRDGARGERVREALRRESGNDDIAVVRVDLASLASVRAAADEIEERFPHVHVLVNNAGVHAMRRVARGEGFEMNIAVNHLGPFLLTRRLLPRLRASAPSRIIIVTSVFERLGRLSGLEALGPEAFHPGRSPAGFGGYFRSKLANLLFAFELGRRLEGTGISVFAVHPGLVATSLMRELPRWMRASYEWMLATPEEGARAIVSLASAPQPATRGARYVGPDGREARASRRARSEALAARLWEVSEAIVAVDGSVGG